mgnify:CR=1 FL=1
MEKPPSFENKESGEPVIDGLIEKLGEEEGMNAEDIISDIVTFLELSQEDEGAKEYLGEVAEKIGINIEEMMRYAADKAK